MGEGEGVVVVEQGQVFLPPLVFFSSLLFFPEEDAATRPPAQVSPRLRIAQPRVGMHEYYNAGVQQSLKSTTRQVPNASKICGRINKDGSTREASSASGGGGAGVTFSVFRGRQRRSGEN